MIKEKNNMTQEEKQQLIKELAKIDVGGFIKKNKKLLDALANNQLFFHLS